jgi:hypothetical protein
MTQECYVLGEDRSANFALAFLDHFLPRRIPFSDEYPIPESSDCPSIILRSDIDIITYLERHSTEPYGLYWNDSDQASVIQAMLFYTRDEKVIFGIADEESRAEARLEEMKKFIGSKYALLGSESRPSDTAREFIALSQGWNDEIRPKIEKNSQM